MIKRKLVFGGTLDTKNVKDIPKFILDCIEHLKNEKYHVLGLFRKSGSNKEVRNIKKRVNKGKKVKLAQTKVHTVASVLKCYFRELKESVCHHVYNMLLASASINIRKRRNALIRKVITTNMPKPHFILLERLINMLSIMTKKSFDKTKMDVNAMATVFAPSLFRKPKSEEEVQDSGIDDSRAVVVLMQAMIEDYKIIFLGETGEKKKVEPVRIDLMNQRVIRTNN